MPLILSTRRAWALVILALIACTPPPPTARPSPSPNLAKDQVLRVAINHQPGSLDPGQGEWRYEAAIVRQIAEPLLHPAPDLTDVQPAAAESYDVSQDGLTYTFHLRKNGRYSDGQPVRARDFVYAWQRLIDPRLVAPHATFFASNVKGGLDVNTLDPKRDAARIDEGLKSVGLKATDDYTFQVVLARPQASFKWVAALWTSAPIRKDVVDKYGEKWASRPDQIVTNGPYRVTELAVKDHVTLEPNPSYWGSRPALKSITFYVIDNDEATIAKFRNGLVDVIEVPLSATDAVRGDARLSPQLVKTPLLEVFWLDFNTQKPPFNNVRVRQAFAMAIDRTAYAADALKGRAAPALAPIPKPLRGAQAELNAPQAFDAAKAKATLDSAGVPADQVANIRFVVRNTPADRLLAEFIVAQIKRNLGLTLVIDATDIRAIGRKVESGDFQLSGPTGWTADYPDEQDVLDLWRRSDGNNHARYDNQRYDDLIKQADSQRDQAKRDQLYLQAQRILVQDAPSAFLDQTVGWWLVRPQVRGAFATALDDWPGDLFVQRIYLAA